RFGQRCDRRPRVLLGIVGKTLRVRRVVLPDEATDCVKLAVEGRDADVVCTLRERRDGLPAIGLLIVNVMIVAVDALLAVTADEMHLSLMLGRPRHFA